MRSATAIRRPRATNIFNVGTSGRVAAEVIAAKADRVPAGARERIGRATTSRRRQFADRARLARRAGGSRAPTRDAKLDALCRQIDVRKKLDGEPTVAGELIAILLANGSDPRSRRTVGNDGLGAQVRRTPR